MILPIVCLDNTMACKQKSLSNLVGKSHISHVKATNQILLMNMLAHLASSFQSYSTHYKQRMLFFSGSTKRHSLLNDELENVENSLKLQNLLFTRWTVRPESLRAMWMSYEAVLDVLETISNTASVDAKGKAAATGLSCKTSSSRLRSLRNVYEDHSLEDKSTYRIATG